MLNRNFGIDFDLAETHSLFLDCKMKGSYLKKDVASSARFSSRRNFDPLQVIYNLTRFKMKFLEGRGMLYASFYPETNRGPMCNG